MATRRKPAHQAHLYAPLDRVRRPFRPGVHDEPVVVRMQWTDEALALLVILREILAAHVEQIRGRYERGQTQLDRHLRLGMQSLGFVDTLITSRPTILVLEPTAWVDNAVILYLDAMIGALRQAGPIEAGRLLQSLGWQIRQGATLHSPDRSQRSSPCGVYYSPTRQPCQPRPAHHSPTSASPRAARAVYRSPERTEPQPRIVIESWRR